jgi:hypothetical protein
LFSLSWFTCLDSFLSSCCLYRLQVALNFSVLAFLIKLFY